MTSRFPTDDEAQRAASYLLGSKLAAIEAVPSFAGNRVFRATTPAGVVFLKFSEPAALATEHAVLRLVQSHQVPVPQVAAADTDGRTTGHACLALWEVAGRPLTGDETMFSQTGPVLQRIHSIRCNGFGDLTARRDGELRGGHASWADVLRHRVNSATPVAAAGLVSARLIERAREAVEAIAATVARPRNFSTATSIHATSTPTGRESQR
jgi:Ser/Thr protein kinase RdoA (MazF antagonist)